ncbi:hypothetical protein BC938DRAFT_470686 [Jimgerdemannia flammicorona]|uniref:proline--tRNA ligase n=1 Tax=Jimgerdemannia flammicorona TaxID=994334 RepID=A0A433Q9R4_9FUNG|nr:hypothetical protein BC938DRAFT_470686 [Jimgerdemannia flammicorona]
MATYEAVTKSFSELSITHTTVTHTVVTDNKTWTNQLVTVAPPNITYHVTKSLVLKPKTAKTGPVTPVVVVALEETETPLAPLGKKLGFKEPRFANEELLQEVFGVNKDSVSPFALAHVKDLTHVHLVVDSALLAIPADHHIAFHPSAADKTSFISVAHLRAFFTHVRKDFIEVDFKALASEVGAPAPAKAEGSKKEATKKEDAVIEGAAQIGIEVRKELDFPKWYQQVLTKSEMLEYYDVSGCYILRPWAYNIWKEITAFFDAEIMELGVEDAYFPMFVSSKVLEREKDHIEGFAPEVAWVTKAGQSDLEEPVALRPTSETVMYPYFAKWIRSHRDLPLKLNQWCNVVRWEFKHPQPFLRTREFLWQEGHTAHLTKPEADVEVRQILSLYAQVYEDLLAVPVVQGVKSEKEKFAGGLYTTTVEGFIPTTGRGIQAGTSHCLGQNFSKMFNIVVEDPNAPANTTEEEAKKLFVWQNSWGLSTRAIGIMVMVHGDDKGLVLPPRVATIQAIVIPCGLTVKTTEEEKRKVEEVVNEVVKRLKKAGVKAKADLRENYTPGYKFNHWELRGVPLRLEIGPQDLKKSQVTSVRRDTGARSTIPLADVESSVPASLTTIQADMYARAKKQQVESIRRVDRWDDFVPALDEKKLVLIPWCDRGDCEENIKERSARSGTEGEEQDEKAPAMGAKSLCRPFDQPTENPIVPGVTKCVACGQDAKHHMLFGRSY